MKAFAIAASAVFTFKTETGREAFWKDSIWAKRGIVSHLAQGLGFLGRTLRDLAWAAVAVGLGGADLAYAATIKVECDVLFQIKTFQPPLTATVPGSLSFASYWLTIDLGTNSVKLYDAPFDTASEKETYKITNQSADFFDFEQGQAQGDWSWSPIQFYIRRSSGWFMKKYGLDKANPKVDLVDVGVCGSTPKF